MQRRTITDPPRRGRSQTPPTLLPPQDATEFATGRDVAPERRLVNDTAAPAALDTRVTPTGQLEAERPHLLLLLLLEGLVELVDDGDAQQDPRPGPDGAHEVGDDRQRPDAHASEGGRRGNVPVEDVDEGRVAVALHDHLVVPELLGNVPGRGAADLDPGLGEEGAGGEDEDEVEDGVEGVVDDLRKGGRGGDVVGDTADGDGLAALGVLPLAEAPMKSAMTVSAPMHMPPKAAAVGMYRLRTWMRAESRWPFMTIWLSRSCLATSRAEAPLTSIQVLEKRAQAVRMKTR